MGDPNYIPQGLNSGTADTDPVTQLAQSWNDATVEQEQARQEAAKKEDANRAYTQSTITSSIETHNQTVDTRVDLTGLIPIPLPSTSPTPMGGVGLPAGGINEVAGSDKSGTTMSAFAYQQIMGAVLDAWVDGAQKAAQASQDKNKQAMIDQMRHHAEQLSEEVQRDIRRQEQGLPPGFFNLMAMAPLMIVLGAVMPYGKVDPTDPGQLGVQALQDNVTAALQMIPSDMRAELGYLGAWLAAAAAFQANVVITVGGGNQNEQQLTLSFAKSYGERILALVQDKNFDSYLDTIVYAKAPGEGLVTAQQAQAYKAALKLGLLVSAFALIYKAEHNGMSGQEVMGRILNQRLEDAGASAPLLDAIRQQLSALPNDQQQQVISRLTAFLNSKPPTDALMDPVKVFQGLTQANQVNSQQATQTSI